MALLAPLFALVGRFVGRVLTTTLGWASILLFGRVPQDRQVWLAVLTFGSIAWVVTAAGVLVPAVGVFLLTALPLPSWINQDLIRVVMLAAALLLPAILGAVALLIADPADRPKGAAILASVARGYLLAPALAVTLVILAIAGSVRKIDSAIHRRTDAHVPMVVRPTRYEALVGDVEASLKPALITGRRPGSQVLTVPARMLAAVAQGGIRRLVPDQLIELVGPTLTVSVYPADLAMSGTKDAVAHARAVVTRDVRSKDAWFTTTKEAQAIEDRLVALEEQHRPPTAEELDGVDRQLTALSASQEEWEVLYRRRLQLVTSGQADVASGRVDGGRPVSTGKPAVADAPVAERPPGEANGVRRLSLGTLVGLGTFIAATLEIILAAWSSRQRQR
jgi:hypothetical protein